MPFVIRMGLPEMDSFVILPPTVTTPPVTETLYGLPAQRYSFTAADINSSNLIYEPARGELWIAESDNYLVQYVISATVKMATPIPNAHILDEGRLNLSYTLTDINTDFEIALPEMSNRRFFPGYIENRSSYLNGGSNETSLPFFLCFRRFPPVGWRRCRANTRRRVGPAKAGNVQRGPRSEKTR